jgi:hypothetical protein
MKVQFNPLTDSIIAFGNNLQGENIYNGPSNYSFEKYSYFSEISGIFNPNGFEIIEEQNNICDCCGQPI